MLAHESWILSRFSILRFLRFFQNQPSIYSFSILNQCLYYRMYDLQKLFNKILVHCLNTYLYVVATGADGREKAEKQT